MSFPLKWIFFSEHLAAMNSIKNILVRFSHPHIPPYQFFLKKLIRTIIFMSRKFSQNFFPHLLMSAMSPLFFISPQKDGNNEFIMTWLCLLYGPPITHHETHLM